MAAFKHLIGSEFMHRAAAVLKAADASFDTRGFHALLPRLEKLELKPRVHAVRDQLHRQLGGDYPSALKTIVKAGRGLRGFDLWPFTEFIAAHGLKHGSLSLEALKTLTPLFTSEFAVRPFIVAHPQKTLAFLERCARDKNPHVRRWASEGSRPRLPWGLRLMALVNDPKPTREILETLKFDDELYVRKSVANHLNDIAKDHPTYVVDLLRGWQKAAGDKHFKKIDWIVRHALRTLIKNGDAGALKLLGVSTDADVAIKNFKLNPKVIKLGDRLEIEFEIISKSAKAQKLVVDYVVHLKKAHGRQTTKVFKLKNFDLPAKSRQTIKKRHHFKKVTTREYYAGEHAVEIQINGRRLAKRPCILKI